MEKLATCLLSLITHFHANFPQSSTIGRLLLWYIFPLDVFPRESPRALLPPKLCNTRSTRISQQHRTFRFVFSIRAHSILSFHTNFPTRFQRATIFPEKLLEELEVFDDRSKPLLCVWGKNSPTTFSRHDGKALTDSPSRRAKQSGWLLCNSMTLWMNFEYCEWMNFTSSSHVAPK